MTTQVPQCIRQVRSFPFCYRCARNPINQDQGNDRTHWPKTNAAGDCQGFVDPEDAREASA